MPPTIEDRARNCSSMLMEALLESGLEAKVARALPDLEVPLVDLTLAWLVSALDYTMSGIGRMRKEHRLFINESLATDFSAIELDAAASAKSGCPFDPDVVPAFLLLAETVDPGTAEKLSLPVMGLLHCACAWDNDRTVDEIARLQEISGPIERRFGFTMPEVTPADEEFYSDGDEVDMPDEDTANDSSEETVERREDRKVQPPQPTTRRPAGQALKDLDALVGLASVKREVRNIVNLVKYIRHRKAAGLPTPGFSLHMVFTGNPGTGKTTVARLVGEIYRDIGAIESGHLIETDRQGLIGKYLGQTAPKTQATFMRAKGGVLFIDEAYTLVPPRAEPDMYGYEAVGTLLKLMEDHRDEVVVITAGYTKEMLRFIDSNPGLKSRFSRVIDFPDYEKNDLVEIFRCMSNANQLHLSQASEVAVERAMATMVANKSEHFGNAREVRILFERALQNQANRLSRFEHPTRTQLQNLLPEDIACN